MWRVGEFGSQILTGPMQLLMQAGAPLRTVRYVINHTIVGDIGRDSIAMIVEAELCEGKSGFIHSGFAFEWAGV